MEKPANPEVALVDARFRAGPMTKRRQVIAVVALLLVIGSVATSFGSFVVSRRSIRSSIVTNALPLTSDSVYSEIQRDLLRPVFVSEQMAHDTFLHDWYTAGETNELPIRRYLSEIEDRFNATTSFFVSERTRNYYHPSGIVQQVNESDPDDAWYFRVRAMSAPYEINIDADLANRETTTVFINFRMVDEEGTYLGVTGVGLTLQSIHRVVSNYESKFRRRIYFVDEQGRTVLDAPNGKRKRADDLRSRPGTGKVAERILRNRTEAQQLSYEFDETVFHVNSRYIPELKWFLIVEQSESDAMQPLLNVLFWNLVVGAAVTTIVLTGLWLTLGRYQRRLEYHATVDSLTKVTNRRRGEELLAESLRASSRVQKPGEPPLTALLLDIDHFKKVNDEHGHLVGDEVIKKFVIQTRRAIRETDHLIRWGGEEFLIILPGCHTDQAELIAQAILDLVATQHLVYFTEELPSVTVSIGIATIERNETRSEFLARLDQALYRAKASGRNQLKVHTFSESIAHAT